MPRIRHASERNRTRTAHIQRTFAQTFLGAGTVVLLILLVESLITNPNPVPAVLTIAGLVMMCFLFSYAFVVPDDLTISATDRTLGIASRLFTYARRGLTPEATRGVCSIILPETMAGAICITDGNQVLASAGNGAEHCGTGHPAIFETTADVMSTGESSVFTRDSQDRATGRDRFPRMQAGIVTPLKIGGATVGTLELYYPRPSQIDRRQIALATGFADLLSSQLASFELERQSEISARVELRALQSQVDPHFLFNTIGTIASLVRTDPERARSLLIDFSNYYRQTLGDSDDLVTTETEIGQGMRYINLMQARFGKDRLHIECELEPDAMQRMVPPFIIQPILENCIKHAMRERAPLHIRLTAQTVCGGLLLTVSDDGLGMSEEVRRSLFDEAGEHRLLASLAADAARRGSSAGDGAAEGGTVPGHPKGRASSERRAKSNGRRAGCGLALSNVLARIRFFFGTDSGIEVESREGVGTRVTVRLMGEPHGPGRLNA